MRLNCLGNRGQNSDEPASGNSIITLDIMTVRTVDILKIY